MHTKKWCFILNPLAGNGETIKKWPSILKMLNQFGISFIFFQTERRGHATQIVTDQIIKGMRRFIAIGGDGTMHECVNGIFQQQKVESQDIIMGIIPIGTGNDWIRSNQKINSLRHIIQSIQKEETILKDVGICHYFHADKELSRYFINVVGLAYDAFVVQYIQKNPPKYLGKIVYLWFALSCLWKYEPVTALLCTDEVCVENAFITMHVGIGKYAGGGMKVLPHGGKNDGMLAIMAAENMPRWKILLNMWRFYFGNITKMEGVVHFNTKSVEIKPEINDIPLEADGEMLGKGPVRIEVVPSAFQILNVS